MSVGERCKPEAGVAPRAAVGLFVWGLLVASLLVGEARAALTREQTLELKTLSGQLADPQRSPKTKLEAAELLLTRTYPEATRTLGQLLSSPANPSAQIAIAQAIARLGGGHKDFIAPLVSMLTGEEPSVRVAAARALVTYKDHGVTDKLVSIALDSREDKPVRLVTVETLGMVLDKRAVDALIRLLDDRDATIRDAAVASLAKLTNIPFGKDRYQWKLWWARNKAKPPSQWLADLADSLVRAKAGLETENAQLRDRLVKTLTSLYAATPEAQKEALLMSFLVDSLADVRLVGVRLATERVSANEELWPKAREQIQSMLADEDPRLRRASAMLIAHLGGGDALQQLLQRLDKEDVPEVRQGLLMAMAHLQDPKALLGGWKEIESKYESVSAAAAAALARMASRQSLSGDLRAKAVKTVVARYKQAPDSEEAAPVREALLTAMGALGDKSVTPLLTKALKATAATVRLAAVNALAGLGQMKAAEAIVPLAADADRGVRKAAVSALGALGGQKYRDLILQRTDPAAEADPAVREQAWEVVMALLTQGDAATLSQVASSLSERSDAIPQRIRILQMLVLRLKASKSRDLPAVQVRLGEALMAASRPAEAAAQLGEAYARVAPSGAAQSMGIWKRWFEALVAANDPAAIAALADQKDRQALLAALERLEQHLEELEEKEKYSAVMLLTAEADKRLSDRLAPAQTERFRKAHDRARRKQTKADHVRVTQLVSQLLGPDESARKAASGELQGMSERAVLPLLAELKKSITEDKPSLEGEKAILAVLAKIAPQLAGYEVEAPLADRVRLITSWERQLLP